MSGLSLQKRRSDDTTGCVLRREVPLRMLAGVPVPVPRSRVHAVVARDRHPTGTSPLAPFAPELHNPQQHEIPGHALRVLAGENGGDLGSIRQIDSRPISFDEAAGLGE